MLTRYSPVGNQFRQVNHKPAVMLRRKIRVLREGWFGVDHKPVEVGQVFEVDADFAAGAVALGRAEYVV